MIKWGTSHVVVTYNDPADFHHLKGAFRYHRRRLPPVPGEGACSEKTPVPFREWNESNLQLCSERQQRILADIWPCPQNPVVSWCIAPVLTIPEKTKPSWND